MAISYKDSNFAKEVITDRYRNPKNKGLKGYGSVKMNKDSCIDDIDVEVKVENDVVVDANWDGVACAISTSAVDIMIDLIKGKPKDEAIHIMEEFIRMANGKEVDESILGAALVFHNISAHTSRIGCATLGPEGLLTGIKEIIAKLK